MFLIKPANLSIATLLLLVGSPWMFLGAHPTSPQSPKNVSLCEILAQPKNFDGQLVTIHAVLLSSGNDKDFDELGPLESEPCSRPRRQDKLRVGIDAGLPSPPDLKVDMSSYEKAAKILDDILQKDPQTRSLLVTVEGIIYDGGPEPSGVRRHPWHPALMLISRWKEIRRP